MYITEKELEKRKLKQFLGTTQSHIDKLIKKANSYLDKGYNDVIVVRGKSHHKFESYFWLVKSDKVDNLKNKLKKLYKIVIEDEVEQFGLSRNSDRHRNIVNNYLTNLGAI